MIKKIFTLIALFILIFKLNYIKAEIQENNDLRFFYSTPFLAATSGILAVGFLQWDWGKGSKYKFYNERFFEQNTKEGGADKLGHAYATYVVADAFTYYLENKYLYSKNYAIALGSLSSLFLFTLIEVGDGTSGYGFSYEDLVADAAGAALSALFSYYPNLSKIFNFRLEVAPNFKQPTAFLDNYEKSKFVFSVKLDGIDYLNKIYGLNFLEIYTSYYTRGYQNYPNNPSKHKRNYSIGLALNVSNILTTLYGTNNKIVDTTFKYYQVPNLYIAHKKKI
jgi:hypothetical protein